MTPAAEKLSTHLSGLRRRKHAHFVFTIARALVLTLCVGAMLFGEWDTNQLFYLVFAALILHHLEQSVMESIEMGVQTDVLESLIRLENRA